MKGLYKKVLMMAAAGISGISMSSCINIDDYINKIDEEPPKPGVPDKPVNPGDLPAQGENQKPSGSGGVISGEETLPGETGEVKPPVRLTLTEIGPGFGDVGGGYEVRVRGTQLDKSGTVSFGSVKSPVQTYVNSSVVRAIVPAGKPGCVDVVWTQNGETVSLPQGFCYTQKVGISSVSPNVIVENTPTLLEIAGTGFDSSTRASFVQNQVSAPLVSAAVKSSDKLTGEAPALSVGKASVVAVGKDSFTILPDAITVLPQMHIDSIEPAAVSISSPGTVTIFGSGFDAGVKVLIGGVTAVPSSVTENRIEFQAPWLAQGAYDAVVYDTWRQTRSETKIHYISSSQTPAVLSVQPAFGPAGAATPVTVTGVGLPQAGNAAIGDAHAEVSYRSETAWKMHAPSHQAGLADVSVGDIVCASCFEYINYPSLLSVSPDHGTASESAQVSLVGENFAKGMRVFFGPWESPSVTVTDAKHASAAVPEGSGTVRLSLVQGRAQAPSDQTFAYTQDVSVSNISPAEYAVTGGMAAYIYGSGFVPGMTVWIDGEQTECEFISGNLMRFTASAHEEGKTSVELHTPDGRMAASSFVEYLDPSGINTSASGGSINGMLNVTVLTVDTAMPIEGASVFIGSDSSALTGTTDKYGRVSFNIPELKGAQVVSACAAEHSCNTLQPVNARDVTLFLEDWHAKEGGSQTSDPKPPPPTPSDGYELNPIDVNVPYTPVPAFFTGKVSSFGKVELASEPDTVKAGIVMQSTLGLYASSYDSADKYLLFSEGEEYRIKARKGEAALALVCGLYNTKTKVLTPKYIGFKRHLMVSDGMTIVNNLDCPIPLNKSQAIKLIDAPLHSGPDIVAANGFINLGNDGYIGGFMTGQSKSELVSVSRLPAPRDSIDDITYAYIVGAYSTEKVEDKIIYRQPATIFYSYDNDPKSDILEVGPAAPIPVFNTSVNEDILETGVISWSVEYPKNVDFYAMTIDLYSSAGRRLLWQFYLPGSAASAEFPIFHHWPEDHSGQVYIQLTAYKSVRDGFDFNLFSTAELRFNYIHSSASSTLYIRDPFADSQTGGAE